MVDLAEGDDLFVAFVVERLGIPPRRAFFIEKVGIAGTLYKLDAVWFFSKIGKEKLQNSTHDVK